MRRGMISAPPFVPPMGMRFPGAPPMMPPLPAGMPTMPQSPPQMPQQQALPAQLPVAQPYQFPVAQQPAPLTPEQIQQALQAVLPYINAVQQPAAAPNDPPALAEAAPAEAVHEQPAPAAPPAPRRFRTGVFSTRGAAYSTRS